MNDAWKKKFKGQVAEFVFLSLCVSLSSYPIYYNEEEKQRKKKKEKKKKKAKKEVTWAVKRLLLFACSIESGETKAKFE